ncbi:protease inhibitor I42 family protein [Chloroflexota bacterium]
MKLRILTCLLIIALMLPFTSCIVTSKDTHVDISCDDFRENPKSTRNDFTIEVGDKVYVELCSNPTTGFKWSYKMTGDSAVKEEGYDFEEPESDLPGAAGKEIWTFEGTSKGITEIMMEYSQPWDGGMKQEWTYKLTITVE